MLRPAQLLSALALTAALMLAVPVTALASSAGDQQYVDPLAGQTHTGSSQPSASSNSSSSPAASQSQATTGSSATAGSTSATNAQRSSAASNSSTATLPRTGVDLDLTIVLGLMLVGSGLALRRSLRVEQR